jgi:hypothetical protein
MTNTNLILRELHIFSLITRQTKKIHQKRLLLTDNLIYSCEIQTNPNVSYLVGCFQLNDHHQNETIPEV